MDNSLSAKPSDVDDLCPLFDLARPHPTSVISIGVAADRNFQYYRAGVLGCTKSGSLNHETALIAYT